MSKRRNEGKKGKKGEEKKKEVNLDPANPLILYFIVPAPSSLRRECMEDKEGGGGKEIKKEREREGKKAHRSSFLLTAP